MNKGHIFVVCMALLIGIVIGAQQFARDKLDLKSVQAADSFVSPSMRQSLTADELNNIEIFNTVSRSTVNVTNVTTRNVGFFSLNSEEISSASGTGFIWSDEGYIVTNFHVIQNAKDVVITLFDKTRWLAKRIGISPDRDLAVFHIEAPKEKLQAIVVDNSEQLQVGRKVLAIGNPFGLDYSLTTGVISALGREINSITGRKIHGVIQTDAAINPGNSGGPLLSSQGLLIGVNTMIFSANGANTGIGFAIPAKIVSKVVPQLIEHGYEIQPMLGLNFLSDLIARQNSIEGVVIRNAVKGSFAERVGMRGIVRTKRGHQAGDVIIELGGEPIKNLDDLYRALEKYKPNDKVKLKTRFGDKEIDWTIRLIPLK